MSQLGQSRHIGRAPLTSVSPSTADLAEMRGQVGFVPKADVLALPTTSTLTPFWP
jgi:hypothetical protein